MLRFPGSGSKAGQVASSWAAGTASKTLEHHLSDLWLFWGRVLGMPLVTMTDLVAMVDDAAMV